MRATRTGVFQLFLLAVLVNILAQAIHETGHMVVYQVYRRDPAWGFIGLVQIWDTQPRDSNHWIQISAPDGSIGWLRLASSPQSKTEKFLEAFAGPMASLLSAILGLWIAYKNSNALHKQAGLMLAMITSFTMTAYYLRSPLRVIGDEFDMASQLGISKGSVEAVLGLAFALCLVLALRLLGTWAIRLKWLAMIILGGVTTGLLLNIADGWVREWVNQGSLFSQSIFGYSLPVLIVYLLAIVGIWLWGSRTREVSSITKVN